MDTGGNQAMTDKPEIDWRTVSWQGSRREQLRRALKLTVRQRLKALESLAKINRHFVQMRAQGKFRTGSVL